MTLVYGMVKKVARTFDMTKRAGPALNNAERAICDVLRQGLHVPSLLEWWLNGRFLSAVQPPSDRRTQAPKVRIRARDLHEWNRAPGRNRTYDAEIHTRNFSSCLHGLRHPTAWPRP